MYLKSVACTMKNPGFLKVTFNLNYNELAAGTETSFVLRNIFNPPSTKPVPALDVHLYDSLGYVLLTFSGTLP